MCVIDRSKENKEKLTTNRHTYRPTTITKNTKKTDNHKRLTMKANQTDRKRQCAPRAYLVKELKDNNAFWSYSDVDESSVDDATLIEKTLRYLDLNEIKKLFELFSEKEKNTIHLKKTKPHSLRQASGTMGNQG